MKQSVWKQIILYISIFLCLTVLQLGSLVLVAFIPRSAIQSNMEESADYLCKNFVFRQFDARYQGYIVDRYADSILLNILYSYDSGQPVSSVLDASYYYSEEENENFNLRAAVYENAPANKSYSRYWHGSIAVLRPLLLFFNLPQIYVLLGALLLFLFLVLLWVIYHRLHPKAILPVVLGSILMSFWYVPLSLEYTWTVLLMLLTSVILLSLCTNAKNKEMLSAEKVRMRLMILFLITGSMTSFLDFLSTETLTLLVPLTFYLAISFQNQQITTFKTGILKLLPIGISWFSGYLFTWLSKWTIASVVLQENVFASALLQAGERINGDMEIAGFAKYPASILMNLNCIWPFNYAGDYGYLLILGLFLIIGMIYFLFRKESGQSALWLFLLLAFVPYLRFVALCNHSYIHYFFTYRAQFTTVLCLGFILIYGLDDTLMKKEWEKRRKKRGKKRRKN